MDTSSEYVLGTGMDERERLGLQHRLWADAAHGLWHRAGVAPGAAILDVGCGPGHAAFELAQWVTSRGRVVGVDGSAAFIDHLAGQAAARDLPQLRGVTADVQGLPRALPGDDGMFDVAWARWVLCFVPDPDAVVAGVARALKPGGRFAVHDYFNYAAMTMAPRRASHDRVVAATVASWRAHGGDPDIAGRLPGLFARHGLRLVHLAVHQRVARGGDPMFAWPDTWWRTYAPKLVEMGYLTQSDCDALFADLDAVRRSETDYIVPPPVTELLAVKR